jgi:nucleotide-binding universal stress UspA family protein
MTYSTVMVHLDVGSSNENLLRVTADLAQRFKANVIGIAACQPMPIIYSGANMPGELIEVDRVEMDRETRETEAGFRTALRDKVPDLGWRSTESLVSLSEYVAQEARAADLLITGPDQGWSALDTTRRVNIGDLLLRVGRPVLIVPLGVDRLDLESVVVGWKETREARRAIADALPFLKKAGRVTVAEVANEEDFSTAHERLRDVTSWLKRHDVVAEFLVSPSVGNDATRLEDMAEDLDAGLLVAGAYGHNRFQEWVLGGVTRRLLRHATRCTLLSH